MQGHNGHNGGTTGTKKILKNASWSLFRVVVETKSIACIGPLQVAQMLTYLRFLGLRHGLIPNFDSLLLRNGIKRVLNGLRHQLQQDHNCEEVHGQSQQIIDSRNERPRGHCRIEAKAVKNKRCYRPNQRGKDNHAE